MAQSQAGGYKAARTNKIRYGDDFYRRIGAMGGRKSRGGGFAANHELASKAGRIGGTISRRGKSKTKLEDYPMGELQDVPPPPKKKRGWGSIFRK